MKHLEKIKEAPKVPYTFPYEYGVGPSFALSTAAALLVMGSCKFLTGSSGIMYKSS
jgi:hypothetical protein